MSRVRPPAVAGLFYPDDPQRLATAVESLLAVDVPADEPVAQALVVPHAGYVYSGPTAGVAYARLRARPGVSRVVLLGPAHRVWTDGLAVPSVDGFATPLGMVPIDDALRRRALGVPWVTVDDAPHAREHSLEVQLPFLQRLFGAVSLLPLAVGDARPHEVAEVLDVLWDGPETLVLVSTDLSHYLDYASARMRDERTAAAIVAADAAAIEDDDACGARPLRGLLVAAARRGLDVRLLDLRSSGDTAGDRDRVVGYGAFAVTPRSAADRARPSPAAGR